MRTGNSAGIRSAGRTAVVALLIAGCAEQATAPEGGVLGSSREGRSALELDVMPSSTGWQLQARALVAANNISPLAAARVLAALGVAQYRAVVAIDDRDGGGVLSDQGIGAGGRAALEGRRGAVAGASAQVLSFFFAAAAGSLEGRVAAEGAAGPGELHPEFARGLELGRSTGDAVVQRTRTDRFTTPWTGTVPTGPGMWTANGPPAGATFGATMPWLLVSGAQFRPAAPPAFGSPAFLTDLADTRTAAANLTNEQRASAFYWNFPTGTFTGVGYWNLVAGDYVTAYGLNERAATRVFALTNAAMMDALIGCWEAKYYYWTIRPSQADPMIGLTFGLPNHPSYPSGHSCVSAAAATVLGSIFPQRTTELAGWVTDAGLSRIYAGIHYRFDITAGRNLGVAVGEWAIALEAELIR